VLCDFFARNAVHAAMAGKTGLVIGPVARRLHPRAHRVVGQPEEALDLNGAGWRAVLAATDRRSAKETGVV